MRPFEINNKTTLLRKHKELEKLARRKVADGFPRPGPFTSPDEIHAYLHADRITCLLCGRALLGLAGHLSQVHLISADDYRERYGLPYRCGLTSAGTKSASRDAQINQPEAERARRAELMRDPTIKQRRLEAVSLQRTSGLKRMQARQRFRDMSHEKRWGNTEAEQVVALMESSAITLKQALRASGRMKETCFRGLLAAYPGLSDRYEAVSGAGMRLAAQGNKHGAGSKAHEKRQRDEAGRFLLDP